MQQYIIELRVPCPYLYQLKNNTLHVLYYYCIRIWGIAFGKQKFYFKVFHMSLVRRQSTFDWSRCVAEY